MNRYRQNLMESTTRGEVLAKFRNHMEMCNRPLTQLEEDMYVDNMTLPYEILMMIFKQLPIEARKNVKLSCKYFKDICDRISLKNEEKLVFPENASFTTMVDVLELTKSTSINLVLYGHNFDLLPVNVWTKFGPKIRSIELYFCDFSTVSFRRLMQYCVDLENMVIRDDRRKEDVEEQPEDVVEQLEDFIEHMEDVDEQPEVVDEQPKIVDELGELDFHVNGTTAKSFVDHLDYYLLYGVSHKRLKTLTLRSEKPLIKESFMVEKILEIFPGIKQFHFDGQFISR